MENTEMNAGTVNKEIENIETESTNSGIKKYRRGYVPGVFDLFHAGHLNLLRRAKEQSEYLIAGVLSDELVFHFKKKYPYMPFEERYEIVKAIRYVDEVVKVDFTNTVKMDAFHLYHYDAYFSGDDHINEWDNEKKALQEVGSDIVFIPYTKGVSSTQLKNAMQGGKETPAVYLFGAGIRGKRFLEFLKKEKGCGTKWHIAGILDNNKEKNLTEMDGVTVYSSDYIKFIKDKENTLIVITSAYREDIERQLEELGMKRTVYYEDYPGFC